MPAEILVDDADAWILVKHRWWVLSKTTPSGRVYRYAEAKLQGKKVLLHRVLLGAGPGQVVDHINGNGLDNRRCNLRLCTHAQNMRNRRINAGHAYGFKGVGRRQNGLYYAQIRAGKIRRTRSGFSSAEAAAAAYAEMAAELHGAFASASVPPFCATHTVNLEGELTGEDFISAEQGPSAILASVTQPC